MLLGTLRSGSYLVARARFGHTLLGANDIGGLLPASISSSTPPNAFPGRIIKEDTRKTQNDESEIRTRALSDQMARVEIPLGRDFAFTLVWRLRPLGHLTLHHLGSVVSMIILYTH